MNRRSSYTTGRSIGLAVSSRLVSMLIAFTLAWATTGVSAAQSTDAMLTAYISGLNARMPPSGDPATVPQLFTDDAVHYHPLGEPPGGPLRGHEALKGFFSGFNDAWADWTHIEKRRSISGRRAIWEGTAEGTHKQSGKYVKLPIVFIIDFDEAGKVKEKTVYVDTHMIAYQVR